MYRFSFQCHVCVRRGCCVACCLPLGRFPGRCSHPHLPHEAKAQAQRHCDGEVLAEAKVLGRALAELHVLLGSENGLAGGLSGWSCRGHGARWARMGGRGWKRAVRAGGMGQTVRVVRGAAPRLAERAGWRDRHQARCTVYSPCTTAKLSCLSLLLHHLRTCPSTHPRSLRARLWQRYDRSSGPRARRPAAAKPPNVRSAQGT
jgi:hypothetical protein